MEHLGCVASMYFNLKFSNNLYSLLIYMLDADFE